MPVEWTISHPNRLVLAIARDDVTVKDIEEYFAGVNVEGGMSYRKIFDAKPETTALSPENIRALGAKVVQYAKTGKVGPVAIVAKADEIFAKAQIFAEAAAQINTNRPIGVFRELHLARKWLDNQPD